MYRRPAVTLTEVLIAIFVMALGLMSILALFPMGALQMKQALADQRAAEAAANATALFRIAWKDACELGVQGLPTPRQRFVIAMNDPSNSSEASLFPQSDTINGPQNLGPAASLSTPFNYVSLTGTSNPSFPVFIDPIGWQSNSPNPFFKWWIAGNDFNLVGGNSPPLPRRPFFIRQQLVGGNGVLDQFMNLNLLGTQRILRQFSLLDDMTFAPDGSVQTNGGAVERQGRYSWAYMVRRANNQVARQVDLSVVVYSNRSIDVASAESMYLASVDPTNGASVTLNYASRPKPAIRRGSWVLDATMSPIPQGVFYRVVNVNDDNVAASLLRLELQTPVRAIPGNPGRRFAALDGVIEVFDKGTIDPKGEIRPF